MIWNLEKDGEYNMKSGCRVALGQIEEFKASTSRGAGIGCGPLIHDQHGAVLALATRHIREALVPELAEAITMNWAIDVAINLSFNSLMLEMDGFIILQQIWKRCHGEHTYLHEIVQECKDKVHVWFYGDLVQNQF
ncbi:hypothetical protein RIF29_18847 [Crotalaria pallida]|uniref:RNase H type-1 domain-containing protein n=1 Tax=Crotalaria pallida TaxID=3830 RepID=A0AAN9F2W1_CROPI